MTEAFGTHSYPGAVLYSKADWIQSNPDTVRMLARAIVRTLDWMHAHSVQEIVEKTPKSFRGEDDAVYVEALKNSMPMFSLDGAMAPDGAEAVHTLLAGSMEKVKSTSIDLSKTYTNDSSMDAKTLLFVGLAIAFVVYAATVVRGGLAMPTGIETAIGFVTAFFDTLGVGSFATTTAVYKLRDMVPVALMPGTLNVGHALATITQAFIYTSIVPVDATTLVLMIAAASAGSWLGAGVVVHWPRRRIQLGMGVALLGAAGIMLLSQLNLVPGGGDTLALTGARLAIGLVGNFVLGVLMMLGIGLYAPCMILVSLLGMNPKAAFPIMMGSCAFLMPISSMRFVRTRRYDVKAALGLALGGFPAVLIAAHTSCDRFRLVPSAGWSWASSSIRR